VGATGHLRWEGRLTTACPTVTFLSSWFSAQTSRFTRFSPSCRYVLVTMPLQVAFLFGRLGWNKLGGNLIISGAFGLFERSSLLATGGYAHNTVGEDMELVVRLRRHAIEHGLPGKVAFVTDPVAWTEAPESLQVLGRQRDRWHRGLADTLWRHRKIFFNPAYGSMGLISYPYFVLFELIAPIVEIVGLIGLGAALALGALNVEFAILFFLAAYGYGLLLTTATFLIEEYAYHRYETIGDRLLMLLWALLENFGYRQLAVLWRIQGLVKYLRGRTEWGAMQRRGFTERP
jgi:cellulose synthase/poly-beta-1,6-N-acetylglucosamine synthase-like glycosyltransferase